MFDREWVSMRDPDDDHLRYTFDVSFLLSGYRCIYGAGCPGITEGGARPDLGCCLHGAYYTDDEDRRHTESLVGELLDPGLMQFHELAVSDGVTDHDDEGEAHTRIVDGACIFLNRAGFPAGSGCALHLLAMERGEHHMTHKPTVCWQVPLHRWIEEQTANDGTTFTVHTIGAFERGTWGEGGADFHWWCTEEPEAFTSARPLYRSMEQELRAMVGDEVYAELAGYLDRRRRQRGRVAFLPMA